MLVAQEPWKPANREPLPLEGFRTVGGDSRLFTWIGERRTLPPASRLEDVTQRIELGWLVVFNTYLDAYAQATRADQLARLRRLVEAEDGRPVLVIGDFNLAPRPEDGRYDGRPSIFNAEIDRAPFGALLAETGLVDCTAEPAPIQYSFSRKVRGKSSERV